MRVSIMSTAVAWGDGGTEEEVGGRCGPRFLLSGQSQITNPSSAVARLWLEESACP